MPDRDYWKRRASELGMRAGRAEEQVRELREALEHIAAGGVGSYEDAAEWARKALTAVPPERTAEEKI